MLVTGASVGASLAQTLLQALVNGLALGSVFALSAMGFAIVSHSTRGLHVAHGGVVAAGGVVSLVAHQGLGLPAAGATLAGVAAAILLGGLVETVVYRPLARRQAGAAGSVVASLGAYLVVTGLLSAAAGARSLPPMRAEAFVRVGPATVGETQAAQILVAGGSAFVLLALFRVLPLGRVMRAQADDPELLAVLDGPRSAPRLSAAVLGAGLAGLAGALAGLDVGADAAVGLNALITAVAAGLLAGRHLTVWPMAAGLALGVLQSAVATIVSVRWTPAAAYLLLIVVLLRQRAHPDRLVGESA
jgi:branched-chain amino acid transport system permease protein